ncbi:phosphatidylinositol-specific phospholipase C/glycerophosphodiester phosphodiesterase family protein [Maribacter algicola]|uniref:Phosphatidylinositol-specific phospholipase C/glycerophosphodiester phosphodiesterase family protein n=1 Tax=Meishania litoralis TaxID=3434685 RepID=A0ACC7LHN4_9FLAO
MKILTFLIVLISGFSFAQNINGFRVHSHNDYLQNVPFWKALSASASSVEADVFLVGDELLVAHTQNEIDTLRNLEKLYLKPLAKSLEIGFIDGQPFQLLIDIKSEAYGTLDAIVASIKKYPSIINSNSVSIVISGNRPKASEYIDYPDFIHFDYQSLDAVNDTSILEKIALVSLSFKNFSAWNGKGRPTSEDEKKIVSAIEKAHALGKPFRFWATPDSKTAWKTLVHLGVDFINTDMPFECAGYLNKLNANTKE